jgi:type IV secretion system protein VirD4
VKKSNIVFLLIIACLVFYVFDRCGELYFSSQQVSAIDKLSDMSDNINSLYENPYIALDKNSLLCGIGGAFAFGIFVLYTVINKKNFRQGEEHGSAKWGMVSDIAKYIDKNFWNNVLLTMTERLSLNTRQTMRNLNILVIGGSGSGKTRFFLKPNLMQLHTSYVITDPNGLVY